jgi:hypothetical protein
MKLLLYLTYALILSGYIVSIAFPEGSIAGYSCVVVGLFTLLIQKLVPLTSAVKLSIPLFIPLLPMIAILGISGWLLAINVKFYKNIKIGNVTSEYKMFNKISFILLLLQLVLLYRNDPPGTVPNATAFLSVIASFQLIVVFIIQMNLDYFMTDG